LAAAAVDRATRRGAARRAQALAAEACQEDRPAALWPNVAEGRRARRGREGREGRGGPADPEGREGQEADRQG